MNTPDRARHGLSTNSSKEKKKLSSSSQKDKDKSIYGQKSRERLINQLQLKAQVNIAYLKNSKFFSFLFAFANRQG